MKFYGYKRCGTSRKAEKALEELGLEYKFIDITINAPSQKEIKKIVSTGQIPLKKCLNTSGVVYKEQKIKDRIQSMNDQEIIKMLSADGRLCKRPMVITENKASVGYKAGDFEGYWS